MFALPAPTIQTSNGGECTSDAQCADNLECREVDLGRCDSDSLKCYCLPTKPVRLCESDSECGDDMGCLEFAGGSTCIESELLEIIRDAGVCIAIDHLNEFDTDELVFADHRKASVLCDKDNNCATAGHIVVWNGKGMMMKSYCDLIDGCTKKTVMVNSPKWKRGLRVKGNGQGLEFSALAARYETKAEEAVMDIAVRMGI